MMGYSILKIHKYLLLGAGPWGLSQETQGGGSRRMSDGT